MYYSRYKGRRTRRNRIILLVLLLAVLTFLGLILSNAQIRGQLSSIASSIFANKPTPPDEPSSTTPTSTVDTPQTQPVTTTATTTTTPAAKPIRALYAGESDAALPLASAMKDGGYNAVILDVKDDSGKVTYASSNPEVIRLQSSMGDQKLADTVSQLKAQGIYTIARIVCFPDDTATRKDFSMGVTLSGGILWLDRNNERWLSPYSEDVWSYIGVLAGEAADMGFDEILLDGVQFPVYGKLELIDYKDASMTRSEAIRSFIQSVSDRLSETEAKLSLAFPGLAVVSEDFADSAGLELPFDTLPVDTLCPILWPSSFTSPYKPDAGVVIDGVTYAHPDKEPGPVVGGALAALRRQITVESSRFLRPWLKSFTATSLGQGRYAEYTAAQVQEQVKACETAETDGWMLYNPEGTYFAENLNS